MVYGFVLKSFQNVRKISLIVIDIRHRTELGIRKHTELYDMERWVFIKLKERNASNIFCFFLYRLFNSCLGCFIVSLTVHYTKVNMILH